MPTIREACRVCGQSLVIHIAQPFVQAAAVAPVCPACTDLQFLDQGGALVALRRDLPGARFPLGKITITGGAVEALSEASQHAVEFLARHARGDWGAFGRCDQIELTPDEQRRGWEATDDTAKINKSNLLNRRDSLMSEYTTARACPLWVVTHLSGAGGTTVLLPEEY